MGWGWQGAHDMSPRCRGVLLVMWLVFLSPLPYMLVAKFGRASGGRLGLGGLGLGLRIGLLVVLGLGFGLVLGLGLGCGPVAPLPRVVTGRRTVPPLPVLPPGVQVVLVPAMILSHRSRGLTSMSCRSWGWHLPWPTSP